MAVDFKSDILERHTQVKGLNFQLNVLNNSQPCDKEAEIKAGFDFNNSTTKFKWVTNVRNFISEGTFTHHCCARWLVGGNFIVDPKLQILTSYNAGLTWEPADKAYVSFRHESVNKKKMELGKFYLYFFHCASSANTIGTEFMFDWQKRGNKGAVEAKVGINHKFDDRTNVKLKVD